MKTKHVPTYDGDLRRHTLQVPRCISNCGGIRFFGRRIKSFVFSTDVAIIKNINGDAIMAVYGFTPQPAITQAIVQVSDVPVFVGVGGGITNGRRSVAMAIFAEQQGAYGVVCNAQIIPEAVRHIKESVEIPVIVTVASRNMDVEPLLDAGADIINVSCAAETPQVVAALREKYPMIPIIATGGPTDETIMATIEAGANAITYTPPTTQEVMAQTMRRHREQYEKR